MLDIIRSRFDLKNKQLLDVGCGDGDFARQLADLGARVTGIEPDSIQANKNQQMPAHPGVTLLQANAEDIPLPALSQDMVLFRFSLHHIPVSLHQAVFEQVARVLKPGGQLFIMEPVAAGTAHYVMALFHDETKVRACAQDSLLKLAPRYFRHQDTMNTELVYEFANFAAYVARYDQISYNGYSTHQVTSDAVKARYRKCAAQDQSARLTIPVKADLFVKLN